LLTAYVIENNDNMKAIHYDTESDILSVTFSETENQNHVGLELSDNIVFYYNPETKLPLKLVLLSYRAMLQASAKAPILLDGLNQAPIEVQTTIAVLLKSKPVSAFVQIIETIDKTSLTSKLHDIFTPDTLQMVAAG
jgi:hypothetical protein